MSQVTIVVVGGGAAGFFGAISCAQKNPDAKVILLEKNRQVLSKVRISGGGRCNVTHSCFDPRKLVEHYPRGNKALLGPFTRFQPRDTIQWFESRGVPLKTEDDGRMFPTTDSSESIIQCLQSEVIKNNIEIRLEAGVNRIERISDGFNLDLSTNENLFCHRLLIATGSSPKIYECLKELGHSTEPLVPSLFTFNIPNSPFLELAGISLPKVHIKILGTSLQQSGPLLITHWGFSGPAVLKLSAWGARILNEKNYEAEIQINWLPEHSLEEVKNKLISSKKEFAAKQMSNEQPFDFAKNLWKKFLEISGIPLDLRWAMLSKAQMDKLTKELTSAVYKIKGKTTYKEEFVTCGGIKLEEVNFKTMESKIVPGLYFAGEVLDIDGITGGFNFQNAWTTSWIAGQSMVST